jgi:uncharacterized short protein YbdD (DUF466 family)
VTGRLGRGAGRVLWYLREVLGEHDYDRYLEHQRRAHPAGPVLSRREFERRRMDRLEVRPGQRCC